MQSLKDFLMDVTSNVVAGLIILWLMKLKLFGMMIINAVRLFIVNFAHGFGEAVGKGVQTVAILSRRIEPLLKSEVPVSPWRSLFTGFLLGIELLALFGKEGKA